MIDKNQAVAIIGLLFFGAAAIYLFQLSGINAGFLDDALSKTFDSALTKTMLVDTNYLLAGILALSLSFVFVGMYALITNKIDRILIFAGALMIPFSLLFIGMSLTGAIFGAGLFLSMILMQYLPIDDAKAYKELRPARIIRKAAGSSILLTSLLVALSVFFVVSGSTSYAENGINRIVDTIIKITVDKNTLASVEQVPGGVDMLKNQMQSSEMIAMMKAYYPHLSAITAFSIVQVIGILAAPIAGIFAWILWKMNESGNKSENT